MPMHEWITGIRELGLLFLLVAGCLWLAKNVPGWISTYVELKRFIMAQQAEEREKDRLSRHEVADRYSTAISDMFFKFRQESQDMRTHDNEKHEKHLVAMTTVCKFAKP